MHALSFAMATGQRPARADLDDAGLSGVDVERVDAMFEHREPPRREEPRAAAEETAPVREPQIGLVGVLAPEKASN